MMRRKRRQNGGNSPLHELQSSEEEKPHLILACRVVGKGNRTSSNSHTLLSMPTNNNSRIRLMGSTIHNMGGVLLHLYGPLPVISSNTLQPVFPRFLSHLPSTHLDSSNSRKLLPLRQVNSRHHRRPMKAVVQTQDNMLPNSLPLHPIIHP